MDDLIFSGAGSGCRGDDEDECTPPFENGSGDDLITPVYVPPTKQTTPAAGQGQGGRGRKKDEGKLCDDEDCMHGSGSGEVTEVFTSSTAKVSGMGLWDTLFVVRYLKGFLGFFCRNESGCDVHHARYGPEDGRHDNADNARSVGDLCTE